MYLNSTQLGSVPLGTHANGQKNFKIFLLFKYQQLSHSSPKQYPANLPLFPPVFFLPPFFQPCLQ